MGALMMFQVCFKEVARVFQECFKENLPLKIVKTPTTTSIQLNTTTVDVGFDMIMTVHHHPTPPHPPHQELYPSSGEAAE